MKILYLCPSPHLGIRDRSGWSTHMSAVILALRAHGHSVRQFLATGQRPLPAPAPPSWLRRVAPTPLRLARRDIGELLHDRGLDRRILEVCRDFEPEAIYERTEIN